FGCGSSREHAVWALQESGFRAVIAPTMADIFRSNAIKNGLVPVELNADAVSRLLAAVQADANTTITVDVATRTVAAPGVKASFRSPTFSRRSCWRASTRSRSLSATSLTSRRSRRSVRSGYLASANA